MKTIISALTVLLCVCNLHAQTDVMGTIAGQVWTKEKSSYRVIGDLQIASLEIHSGVTVLFMGQAASFAVGRPR